MVKKNRISDTNPSLDDRNTYFIQDIRMVKNGFEGSERYYVRTGFMEFIEVRATWFWSQNLKKHGSLVLGPKKSSQQT